MPFGKPVDEAESKFWAERKELDDISFPKEIKIPEVAWPTVIACFSLTTIWLITHIGYQFFGWTYWMCCLLWWLCLYYQFSCLHDSVHSAIVKRGSSWHWLNELCGNVAATMFIGEFKAWRFNHLSHHKNVNKGADDPDHWCGTTEPWWPDDKCQVGPLNLKWILLPLKWLTMLHALMTFSFLPKSLAQRSPVEIRNMSISVGVMAFLVVVSVFMRNFNLVWVMLVPEQLAMVSLTFTFAWLPHRPHKSLDSYEQSATVILYDEPGTDKAVLRGDDESKITMPWSLQWLTIPMCWHNYHAIHHRYPFLPCYLNGYVWELQHKEFAKHGALYKPIFGFDREKHC